MYVKIINASGDVLMPPLELPRLPSAGDTVAWDVDLLVQAGSIRWERLPVCGPSMPRWVAVLVGEVVPGTVKGKRTKAAKE